MSGAPRILLVEDDGALRDSLAATLRSEGYEVRPHGDGRDVATALRCFVPDLAILDVRLPDGPDGFALGRLIVAHGDVAVLYLTAAGSLADRLDGFDAGADDYLVKPFAMPELLARINALLRRAGRLTSPVHQMDDLVVDESTRTAHRGDVALDLTPTEFDLLVRLLRSRGRVLSKPRLLALVWDYEDYDLNVVEVHVSSLRRKLERHGPRLVHTVRGAGYVARPA